MFIDYASDTSATARLLRLIGTASDVVSSSIIRTYRHSLWRRTLLDYAKRSTALRASMQYRSTLTVALVAAPRLRFVAGSFMMLRSCNAATMKFLRSDALHLTLSNPVRAYGCNVSKIRLPRVRRMLVARLLPQAQSIGILHNVNQSWSSTSFIIKLKSDSSRSRLLTLLDWFYFYNCTAFGRSSSSSISDGRCPRMLWFALHATPVRLHASCWIYYINKSCHQSLLTILRPALRYHFMTASSFNDCCKSRHAVSGELLLMLARSPQIASSLGSRAPLLATLLMLRLLIARPASTLRSSELMTTLRYPLVRYVSWKPPRKTFSSSVVDSIFGTCFYI